MFSLSSPPAQTKRSVSLAHAGKANPTYGEHVCSCAALPATRGLQVDLCYKRPSVCSEIISAASIQSTALLLHVISEVMAVVGQRQLTKHICELPLDREVGASVKEKRQKSGAKPSSVLPCSRRLVSLVATCTTLTICWSPHSQSTRKCIQELLT